MQDLIELADLRVFKLRGTNPQADIFRITRELPSRTLGYVMVELLNFCQRFMPDSLLASRLVDEDLYRNPGLPRMLLEEEALARVSLKLAPLCVRELANLIRSGLTVEHILPQAPNFNVAAYGFGGIEEYEMQKHRIGNLTLLEGPLNSACNNRTVEDKMSTPNLYLTSELIAVRSLAAQFAGQAQGFRRISIDSRAKVLAQLIVKRWAVGAAADSQIFEMEQTEIAK